MFFSVNVIGEELISLTLEEQNWIKDHPVINFAGDPNWLPYEAFDKEGNYIGIVSEHLKLIEQKTGIKFNIIQTRDWNHTIDKVAFGEVDVISETIDTSVFKQFNFSDVYVTSPIVIIMKDDHKYVENLNQIQYKKIALVKNYGYIQSIVFNNPNINFYTVQSIQDGLTSVSIGKIDGVLLTLAQATYHIERLGINNVRIVGKTEVNTQLALGILNEFKPLVEIINKALSAITIEEKTIIFNNWGSPKYVEKYIDLTYILYVTISVLIIMTIIIYWNYRLSKEINNRKLIEKHLTDTQNRLNQSIWGSGVSLWDYNSEFKRIWISPQLTKMLGYDEEMPLTFKTWKMLIHPDDSDSISKKFKKHLRGDVPYDVEYRLKSQTGEWFWFHDKAKSLRDSKGKAYRTSGAMIDISKTKFLENELIVAKDKSDSENKSKSEFLSNMSHEIRTPMNSIIGFSDLLSEKIEDPKLVGFVNTIQKASQNLLTLINDILDLSKIESGYFEIIKTSTNINDLISDICDMFSLKITNKNIEFDVKINPEISKNLHLDPIRLRQVIINLLNNSIKFTQKGYIKLNVDFIKNSNNIDLIIEVSDSGIGIPQKRQKTIFDSFVSTPNPNVSDNYKHTGLGLSISSKLTQLMNGELSVNSIEGKGSKFTIKLFDISNSDNLNIVHPQDINPEQISFHPYKILIVDDLPDNLKLISNYFDNNNIEIFIAENGIQAIELTKNAEPDLILIDIRMPIMDGYQALKEIKAFSNVPVVALTASVMSNNIERLKLDKFDGYIRKPVRKKDLFKELIQYFEYDIIKSEEPPQEIEIDSNPMLVQVLKNHKMLCDEVLKSNNIKKMIEFSDIMENISKRFPEDHIIEYSNDLKIKLSNFEISNIQSILKDFDNLINKSK
jgi:two-component system sensor histidine kinase EvgS